MALHTILNRWITIQLESMKRLASCVFYHELPKAVLYNASSNQELNPLLDIFMFYDLNNDIFFRLINAQ